MPAPSTTSTLSLTLFGPFQARVGDTPLPRLRSHKGEWLLALLALRGESGAKRDWLAGTFWPESEESLGLYYLRRELSGLRQALGQEASRLIACPGANLRLDLTGARCDVREFDSAVASADPSSLQAAVSLYRGPLLEGCSEEWVLLERASREQAYLAALEELGARELARHEYAAAVSRLRLAVAADPLRESAYRALIRALAADGEYAAALETYRTLRTHLHRELNAAPDPRTTTLFEEVRARARRKAPAAAAAPPVHRARPAPSHSGIPRPLTPLLGREEEVWEVRSCLGPARLVTLTGAGGIGKTRLAMQVAEELKEDFAAGACWVELASVSDPARLPQSLAGALRLKPEPGQELLELLVGRLASAELLLVLDNCEHLLDACATVADSLLRRCPGLRILATSREPLGLAGETAWRVPSLAVPPPLPEPQVRAPGPPPGRREREKDLPTLFMEYDAVRLFVERARQAQREFALTPQNAEAVARICRRLDGIPLAIELAAVLVRGLPPSEIDARLRDRFELLTGGSRAALPRHQTLRAAIGWSYDLLAPAERALLHRLSVFAGGWTLGAAEGVCTGEPVPERGAASMLARLVDKSLVVCEPARAPEAPGRYRLPETLREYASERLRGDREAVRQRHAGFYLEWAEALSTNWASANAVGTAVRLEADLDNLRLAMAWWRDAREGEPLMRMATALGTFWMLRSHYAEGREWLGRALELQDTAPLRLRARAHKLLAVLAIHQADVAAARDHATAALPIAEELGDRHLVASLTNDLGTVAECAGDLVAARQYFQEALAVNRELGEELCVAMNLGNLGNIALEDGEPDEALRFLREGVEIARRVGSQQVAASLLNSMGAACRDRGALEDGRSLGEEALRIERETGQREGEAWSLDLLGTIAARQGALGAAGSLLAGSLTIRWELGHRLGVPCSLESLAYLAACRAEAGQDAWDRAARLAGAAHAQRETGKFPASPAEQRAANAWLALVRAALGEEAFECAWAEGLAMPTEAAVDYALAE